MPSAWARARHVVLSASPGLNVHVRVFRGREIGPEEEAVASAEFDSTAEPTWWETPRLEPGLYVVYSYATPIFCYTTPGIGCIAWMPTIQRVLRVPAVRRVLPAARPKRGSSHTR